jgi:drug/metabolite transporter (DMT)-like permease
MLVIIRPGFVDISIGVYMVLFSALLWSINIIITKKISKDDSAITILAYQSIL